MTILVTYSSKHGSTKEIAEHVATRLGSDDLPVQVEPMKHVTDLTRYDAFVVGSALYFGSWMKEALAFVRQHQAELSAKPLWLFSSGPLGDEIVDAEGHDLRETAEPKEIDELSEILHPREHVVFFGALDSHDFSFTERLIHALPAGKKLLVEGDFRDWDEIDAWTESIAAALADAAAVQT